MTLGDILQSATDKDLAFPDKKNQLSYLEEVVDDKFQIQFSSVLFPEATIECSVPDKGTEDEKNYLRLYFLSMVFNAAVHGMKRMKHKKSKR
jgi:hypothetical protein